MAPLKSLLVETQDSCLVSSYRSMLVSWAYFAFPSLAPPVTPPESECCAEALAALGAQDSSQWEAVGACRADMTPGPASCFQRGVAMPKGQPHFLAGFWHFSEFAEEALGFQKQSLKLSTRYLKSWPSL